MVTVVWVTTNTGTIEVLHPKSSPVSSAIGHLSPTPHPLFETTNATNDSVLSTAARHINSGFARPNREIPGLGIEGAMMVIVPR